MKERSCRSRIESFAVQLREAPGLKNYEVEKALELRTTWYIGDYILFADHHPYTNWKAQLEVKPADGKIPESWHYKGAGTNTEILPDPDTQDAILALVREWASKP